MRACVVCVRKLASVRMYACTIGIYLYYFIIRTRALLRLERTMNLLCH